MFNKRFVTMACMTSLVLGSLAGCNSEPKDPFQDWAAPVKYHEFVPAGAETVQSGTGVLEYTAPVDGMLYLIDTSKMVQVEGVSKPTVVITGYLQAGKHVIFDPSEKRIRLQGREGVKLTQVDPSHTHEFRFDRNPKKKSEFHPN